MGCHVVRTEMKWYYGVALNECTETLGCFSNLDDRVIAWTILPFLPKYFRLNNFFLWIHMGGASLSREYFCLS